MLVGEKREGGAVMRSFLPYHSPVGTLWVMENGQAITEIRKSETPPATGIQQETRLLQMAVQQLQAYFAGKRKAFSLPLAPEGTPFQKRVWRTLLQIPYGETRSYGQIAQAVGNPKACRAVGMANHRNPILLVVPCHRVIGKNGSLTGYGGGLKTKAYLLQLEQGDRKGILYGNF